MTENDQTYFGNLLGFLFKNFSRANRLGMDAVESATTDEGVDIAKYRKSFLASVAELFGIGGDSGIDGYIVQNAEVAKAAAVSIGHADGVVPTRDYQKFSDAQAKIEEQVADLGFKLRDRKLDLYDQNAPDASYATSFASDQKTQALLEDAANRGLSPKLIESVKSELLQEEQSVMRAHEKFSQSFER